MNKSRCPKDSASAEYLARKVYGKQVGMQLNQKRDRRGAVVAIFAENEGSVSEKVAGPDTLSVHKVIFLPVLSYFLLCTLG